MSLRRAGGVLLAVAALWVVPGARGFSVPVPSVLVLNSYHPGYAWSDDETEAILDTFRAYNREIPVYVEYLDTKRLGVRRILERQKEFLLEKYAGSPPTLLMVCDNNALDFAISLRPRLAPHVPIIFCGINAFTPELLRGEGRIVGVTEDTDVDGNIEVVRTLCPWVTRLFIVNDYTETGRANRSAFEAVERTYAPGLRFVYNDNVTMEHLLDQVRHLPDDTVVMLDAFLVDGAGQFHEPEEVGRLVAQHASVPVFNLNEPMFKGGGVGGLLAMPTLQGQRAAQMAIALFEGTPVDEMPRTVRGPMRLYFNYRELDRHGLDEGNLPPGSELLHLPESLYKSYPRATLVGVSLIVLLGVIVFLLLRAAISRRRATLGLACQQQQLERQVAERTRKLEETQTRLEQRARDLARANEYKTQFLAHISHEVRTPLSAIIGFAEIILYSTSIDFIYQQSQIILNEADHLLTIINQLLDHAKIDAGKFELDRQPFDVHQLLEDMHKSLHHHALRKHIDLAFHYEGVPRCLLGDAVRLRQVLLNLLSNAIKFTHEGGVELTVRQAGGDAGRATLHWAVRDTGIGIAREALEEIFKRFSQADQSVTRRYGGTGLGTSIASTLVELMGGRLQVESKENEGSLFWFEITLPVVHDIEPDQIAPLMPVNISIQDETPAQSVRILVVDDYPSNQSIVRIHLEKAGYTCVVADNGRHAVSVCEHDTFDLILMDLSMPVMDGYEAARRIRAGQTVNARVPILALSAHAGDQVRQKCLDAGMNDIIIKPVHRLSFLRQVDHWLTINELASRPVRRRGDEDEWEVSARAARGGPLAIPLLIHEFAGDRDAAAEALNYFIKDVRQLLPAMVKACQDRDTDFITKEAHKVSGSAGNLCAMRVALHAKRLEELCAGGHPNPGEVMNLLSQLINSFEELTDYLDQQQFFASHTLPGAP